MTVRPKARSRTIYLARRCDLLDAVRLGGSFLFNVGPKEDGSIDEREGHVLAEIGEWMRVHGEAVYGTRPQRIYNLAAGRVQGAVFHYGMWTCKGRTAYLTIFRYPGGELVISKVGPKVLSATLLTTGQPLELVPLSNSRTLLRGLPSEPPDPLAPVVRVEFESEPYELTTTGAEWLDGTFA